MPLPLCIAVADQKHGIPLQLKAMSPLAYWAGHERSCKRHGGGPAIVHLSHNGEQASIARDQVSHRAQVA